MTAKIKLNAASGGGSFSLQAPSSSSNNRVFTLPDSADATLLTSTASLGKILSVQQAVKTDTASFSTGSSTVSDSYFDISGLSVSLTPSSGTKCFVSYTVNIGGENGYNAGIALLRGSTQIYLGDASSNRQRLSNFYVITGGDRTYAANGQFLDTHGADGSTAVTYKLQMYVATVGRTTRVNRSHDNTDNRAHGLLASQITVMEVAA